MLSNKVRTMKLERVILYSQGKSGKTAQRTLHATS